MSFLSRIIGPIVIRRLALARRLARQADKDRDPRRGAARYCGEHDLLRLKPHRVEIRADAAQLERAFAIFGGFADRVERLFRRCRAKTGPGV